jgi:signal transduction histidine kinase
LAFDRQIGPVDQIVELRTLAEEVVRQRQASVPEQVELRLVADSDTRVRGNEAALHRVLSNLVGNAVHATRETGGVIEVRLTNTRTQLVLEVGNHGIGIPPELLVRIFDPSTSTAPSARAPAFASP